MKYHQLKTDPEVFAAVVAGAKTHEIRFNDRLFAVGDILHLRETKYTGHEMSIGKPLEYTGRQATREISHIQTGYGLAENWVILSFVTGRQIVGRRLSDRRPTEQLGWGDPDALYPDYRTVKTSDQIEAELRIDRAAMWSRTAEWLGVDRAKPEGSIDTPTFRRLLGDWAIRMATEDEAGATVALQELIAHINASKLVAPASAPVEAVSVLPDEREPNSSDPRDQAHAAGWNACLDAIHALQGKPEVGDQ